MKKLSIIALAAVIMVGIGSLAMAADPVQMRISHQLPPKHHLSPIIDAFAADIETLSENTIDVQVYGADQLFKADENFPAVAKGSIEAALSVNFQWGSTIPVMNVTLMPYSFTDLDAMEKFASSPVAQFLNTKLEEKGVKNIAWLFITNTSIFTSNGKPLVKPEDFKGVKIRGLNKLVDSGLRDLGAAPSAMSGSEVYQALQTGVLDAGLTDISAAYSRKYYEVQEFGSVSPFFSVFFHIYVNPTWYDGLTDAQKGAIAKASATAEAAAMKATRESAAAAPEQLREKGMKIHIMTPEEIEAIKAVTLPAFEKSFTEAAGDDAKKIIDMLNKL
ncbi:MAG: TRAP transporter substrate-binding protein DctP [Desulfofustis sp.]|nr:TRAP transporter substrate-binding protein DctP [Desulfofustis sp.]